MNELDDKVLDTSEDQDGTRRRDLLPFWIKVFSWIFMVSGTIVPFVFILGILDINISLSIYGLRSAETLSLTGVIIMSVFGLKGIAAFGLWHEKIWAVKVAIYDAVIGLVVCIAVSFIFPYLSGFNELGTVFRLEIIVLIPYLIKLQKIQRTWPQKIAIRSF